MGHLVHPVHEKGHSAMELQQAKALRPGDVVYWCLDAAPVPVTVTTVPKVWKLPRNAGRTRLSVRFPEARFKRSHFGEINDLNLSAWSVSPESCE